MLIPFRVLRTEKRLWTHSTTEENLPFTPFPCLFISHGILKLSFLNNSSVEGDNFDIEKSHTILCNLFLTEQTKTKPETLQEVLCE